PASVALPDPCPQEAVRREFADTYLLRAESDRLRSALTQRQSAAGEHQVERHRSAARNLPEGGHRQKEAEAYLHLCRSLPRLARSGPRRCAPSRVEKIFGRGRRDLLPEDRPRQ